MDRFDIAATIFTYRNGEKQSCLVILKVSQKNIITIVDIILISE